MDYDLTLQQFDEIENKVERLIKVCKSLESSNLEMRNKIDQLNAELQKKVQAENSFAEEKALIRSKIDNLLVKLEEIED